MNSAQCVLLAVALTLQGPLEHMVQVAGLHPSPPCRRAFSSALPWELAASAPLGKPVRAVAPSAECAACGPERPPKPSVSFLEEEDAELSNLFWNRCMAWHRPWKPKLVTALAKSASSSDFQYLPERTAYQALRCTFPFLSVWSSDDA